MAKKVAVTNLNARTIDILNTIRANLSASYQSQVPEVTKDIDIPKVGEVLYGYPALANQFLTELVNRIALVRVKSVTFNNAYAELKKGFLEFGETVEEVFVNICKAREFSAEKAESRELKRSLPDVRSAFHSMNWRVQYPATIQDEDLRKAFLNADGVQDLIAKIVNSVSVAAEYDEFLLFKYLIIKAAAHGKMAIIGVDYSNMDNAAIAFRGASNKLEFMSPSSTKVVCILSPKRLTNVFSWTLISMQNMTLAFWPRRSIWIRQSLWASCILLMTGLLLTISDLAISWTVRTCLVLLQTRNWQSCRISTLL